MTVAREDLQQAMDLVRESQAQLHARTSALLELVARINLPSSTPMLRCPRCTVEKRSRRLLEEHLEHVHGVVGESVAVEETVA